MRTTAALDASAASGSGEGGNEAFLRDIECFCLVAQMVPRKPEGRIAIAFDQAGKADLPACQGQGHQLGIARLFTGAFIIGVLRILACPGTRRRPGFAGSGHCSGELLNVAVMRSSNARA